MEILKQHTLLELNEEIDECIFDLLTPKDLSTLSLCCRQIHDRIKHFIRNYLNIFDRRKKIQSFLQSYNKILKLKEKEFLEKYFSKDTSLNYYAAKLLLPLQVRKFSVADSEDFAHLGNPQHIITEWDELLQLNIVLVRDVCWLSFTKIMMCCLPGRYLARLHIYLGKDTIWPFVSADKKTVIKVNKLMEATKVVLVEETFLSSLWNAVIRSDFDNSMLCHSSIVLDSVYPGWYYFEFESFEINEECDISFEFSDIQNPFWKSNIKFSFIELIRMANYK